MTRKQYGNEATNLKLSDKAYTAYSESDPLEIYEEEKESGYRYDMEGIIEEKDMTEKEVNTTLEDLFDETIADDEEAEEYLDVMALEKIEHEEAKRAADGTDYDWLDLLDFESLHDLKRSLAGKSAAECREAFRNYFENLIRDLKYYDAEDEDEETVEGQ